MNFHPRFQPRSRPVTYRRPFQDGRRGSTTVIIATSFIMLAGFAAMAVDLGYARMVDAQLEVAADSGASGGAGFLDGTTAGVTKAHDAAIFYSAANTAYGQRVSLSPNQDNAATGDVVIGHIDLDAMTFRPTVEPGQANAVMVRAKQGSISASFSKIAFGRDTLSAGACSVAYEPAGLGAETVPYYLPLAVPDCAFSTSSDGDLSASSQAEDSRDDEDDGEEDDDEELCEDMQHDGAHHVRWAISEDASGASSGGDIDSATLTDAMDAAWPCMEEWDSTGRVTDDCAAMQVGDKIRISNRSQSEAIEHVADALHEGVEWDHEYWGEEPERDDDSSVDDDDYGRWRVRSWCLQRRMATAGRRRRRRRHRHQGAAAAAPKRMMMMSTMLTVGTMITRVMTSRVDTVKMAKTTTRPALRPLRSWVLPGVSSTTRSVPTVTRRTRAATRITRATTQTTRTATPSMRTGTRSAARRGAATPATRTATRNITTRNITTRNTATRTTTRTTTCA
ncbi:MAG: hypothetical protein GXP62_18875 [Oligoflexia bacterium]|nr:hypothetical protein [Oligoflexia bacterium]